MHKIFFITIGFIFVGLATLGIFLPLLPTTPLLLLAVACFAKSSKKLHDQLLTNKTFGPLIKQWHEKRSMPLRAKVYALIMICAGGSVSLLTIDTITMKISIAAVLVIPIIIILKIKTSQ